MGFSRGFLVSAGISLLGFFVALVAIRTKRSDLAGVQLPGMPGGPSSPAAGEDTTGSDRVLEPQTD